MSYYTKVLEVYNNSIQSLFIHYLNYILLQREISLSTESATVSLTGIAVFDINPPLAESGLGSECNVNICYLDSYFFGIYSIPSGPMTLSFQDDCRPPAADPLPTSTAHIGDYIHNSAELVSAQDDGVPGL